MLRRAFLFTFVFILLMLLVLSHRALAQDLIVGEYFYNDAVAFTPDGTRIGVFASSSGTSRFDGMAFDANSNLYIATQGSNVRYFSTTGVDLGNFVTTGLNTTIDVAFDHSGNLYVSNFGNNTVRRFSPTGTDMGVFAYVTYPYHMAFDHAGNLYVGSYTSTSVFAPATVHCFSPTG